MRKTKIICTLGPATDDPAVLRELILSGMDVARFNFSHGSHEEQKRRLDMLKQLREELGRPIATLLDTKGPEVRIGTFRDGPIQLEAGDIFTLTTREVPGDRSQVSVSYENLPRDLHVGDRVLLDDGLIEMTVQSLSQTDITCLVANSGRLSDRKGVNLPGAKLTMPFISERDRSDIIFGIENDFDFIAASFTRTADDILDIRQLLLEHNCNTINIIAKIENKEGVGNIDSIISVSDGIMIARGDMGVEIPLEDVPVIQKMIIKKVYNQNKQVITATQMLDSMMKNPRPTRAEATDVANAIYDGTSAIMLSGETAAGRYPIEAVRTMARIAVSAETDIDYDKRFKARGIDAEMNVTNAISHATCTTACDLGAAAIIPITKSGRTAQLVSKYRPSCPIIACTTSRHTYYHLSLSWGITPVMVEEHATTNDLFEAAVAAAMQTGLFTAGELVVLTAGLPLGVSGTTNILKVHVAGSQLIYGSGMTEGTVTGKCCVCSGGNCKKAIASFEKGDILVVRGSDDSLSSLVENCAGLIAEEGGINSHAALAGMRRGIPCVVGAAKATRRIENGTVVTLDATRGVVIVNP